MHTPGSALGVRRKLSHWATRGLPGVLLTQNQSVNPVCSGGKAIGDVLAVAGVTCPPRKDPVNEESKLRCDAVGCRSQRWKVRGPVISRSMVLPPETRHSASFLWVG